MRRFTAGVLTLLLRFTTFLWRLSVTASLAAILVGGASLLAHLYPRIPGPVVLLLYILFILTPAGVYGALCGYATERPMVLWGCLGSIYIHFVCLIVDVIFFTGIPTSITITTFFSVVFMTVVAAILGTLSGMLTFFLFQWCGLPAASARVQPTP